MTTTREEVSTRIMAMNFAAHTVPEIKEVFNGEDKFVLWSLERRNSPEDNKWRNQYPQYLLWLLARSAKHNSIVTSKSQYIYGDGIVNISKDESQKSKAQAFIDKINDYESLSDIIIKAIFDIEVFNGCALRIVGDAGKKSWGAIYHEDFSDWRTNPDSTEFYYTKDWSKFNPTDNEDWKKLPAYDPNKWQKESLLYVAGYRPGFKVYPYPEYIGALPYIECDYEVANFHLNNLKNGFVGSTLINFFNGVPKGQNQGAEERKIKKKFTGTDNTGRVILTFNDGKDKEPTVQHLTPSDMDKQFEILNKTIQQEIIVAHKITSPMLLGIKTEGQLGGRAEIQEAWELFQNTYISYKQKWIEYIFNELFFHKGLGKPIKIKPTQPIGIGISDAAIERVMTNEEIRERVGLKEIEQPKNSTNELLNSMSPLVATKVLESMTPNEVRALAGLPPSLDVVNTEDENIISDSALEAVPVNENIKNLTGRQMQNIERIVRKWKGGVLTREQAASMLRNGYGLNEVDIDLFLVEDVQKFKSDEDMAAVFEQFGVNKDDYIYICSERVRFGTIVKENHNFAEDLNILKQKILEIIKQDPLVTEESIAKVLGKKLDQVQDIIEDMVQEELIKRNDDVFKILKEGEKSITDKKATEIVAMYDYRKRNEVAGKTLLPTSREFCRKMIKLNKYWSRSDIQKISQKEGYNVFDFAGGFWNDDGDIKPHCRHSFYLTLLRKKK